MSTERDIIIERLEQKIEERDKQIQEMQESLREDIIVEIEKRFGDKIKLRESTLEDIRLKFNEKVNEIIEMNKSLRESLLEQKKSEGDTGRDSEKNLNRIERRLMELNSSYDGVMKELLDQKSIIQELSAKANKEKKAVESNVAEKPKPPEKKKSEIIIAENYKPVKKKTQQVIEADEEIPEGELVNEPEKPEIRRTKNPKEGVEITETLRKR